jgi:D-alanyl-D-alanine carboxypeptidase
MLDESILVIEPELVNFNDEPHHMFDFIDSVTNYSLNTDIDVALEYVRNTNSKDLLIGTTNEDTIYGLEGNDLIFGRSGKDILSGNRGLDLIAGGQGDDWIGGGADRDLLIGNRGNDTLVGGSEDDYLWGGQGNDSLQGQSGSDRLWGNKGDDLLDGGAGFDLLSAGRGNDILSDVDGGGRLTGGSGADEFRIGHSLSDAPSTITDFQIGKDKLKILHLGATFNDLTIQNSQNGALILDGDKEIAILQDIDAASLTPDDFLFGNAALAEELQSAINQTVADYNLPGVSVSVIAPDGTTWTGTEGFSNLEANTPLNPDDRFVIASITKMFMATTVLQLVEEEKLSLDDTMSQWLPDIASQIPNGDIITVGQLLNHTSGIREVNDELVDAIEAKPERALEEWTTEELIALIYDKAPTSEPGQSGYSNTNYLLLGEIVEAATDSTLNAQLESRIFEPLGLDNTFYDLPSEIPGGYVNGYQLNENGMLENTNPQYHPSLVVQASRGIISTPTDLARFAQRLFAGEILTPTSLDLMVPVRDSSGYGLGVVYEESPDYGRLQGHDGALDVLGWRSFLFNLPEQNLTVAITSNTYLDGSDPIVELLATIVQETVQKYD